MHYCIARNIRSAHISVTLSSRDFDVMLHVTYCMVFSLLKNGKMLLEVFKYCPTSDVGVFW